MDVQRICFLGTRTANFDATAAFFGDVLGLEHAGADPGHSVFRLPSGGGDYVEVFGREADPSLLPPEVGDGVFVAFAVDDIAGAREDSQPPMSNSLATSSGPPRVTAGSTSALPTATST